DVCSSDLGIPRQREAVRIDFVKEGYRVERREGPFRDLHVVLAPLRATAIEGRLVDPAGRPLAPDDLAFLFGEFGPDAPPPPPFLEPSAVLAVPDRSLGQSDVERPADVADDARFTIPRPPFFAGEVVLVFRGLVLARRSWQEGDPPVVFEVDVAALRRALGRLEVTLEGTSTIPAGEEVEIDVRRRSPITRREEAETF